MGVIDLIYLFQSVSFRDKQYANKVLEDFGYKCINDVKFKDIKYICKAYTDFISKQKMVCEWEVRAKRWRNVSTAL